MLSFFPISILVGAATGFLAALGVGGGSLLILWLNLVLGLTPETARMVNLLFFLPTAAIACIFRAWQKTLSLRSAFPAIAGGCIFAILGTLAAGAVDTEVLKKGFGILLLFTGLRELFYRPRNAR